jgi:hypothetical protein
VVIAKLQPEDLVAEVNMQHHLTLTAVLASGSAWTLGSVRSLAEEYVDYIKVSKHT